MTLFIGLDGGGSGCRARTQRADGTLGALHTGGRANLHTDADGAERAISDVLDRVLRAERSHDPAREDVHIALGLAGATESGGAGRLASRLPYRNLTILGDAEISLAGAFQEADGILMAVGTGSVLARQCDGQMQRIGGYGFALGDEGSGAWLGRRALTAALHVRDGLSPDAPLAQAIWTRFSTLSALLNFTSTAGPADYAEFASQVTELDAMGCPLACAILDEGCAYLLRAIRHLQAGDAEIPVAALGGVGPLLLDRLVAVATPALHVRTPKGNALDGALWYARHMAQITGPPG